MSEAGADESSWMKRKKERWLAGHRPRHAAALVQLHYTVGGEAAAVSTSPAELKIGIEGRGAALLWVFAGRQLCPSRI